MDNPYAAPVSAVSETVNPKKWYVSFARFLCYAFLVLWSLSVIISLMGSLAQFIGNGFYLAVTFISSTIVFFIFNYPLYAFLKFSGKSPDRKARSVIWLNSFASIFVVGLFGYMAIIDSNEMRTIYIGCAIILALPYLLNTLSAYQFKGRM